MRQRVFVLWEEPCARCSGAALPGGCPRCGLDGHVSRGYWEYPDVAMAEQRAEQERKVGLTCVVALGPEMIDDIRPNGGASAIAADLARRSGRSLGRGRKRK